jgi:hypothetical protein
VSAAIRRGPAHWNYWASGGDLARLGVLMPDADPSPAAEPTLAPTVEPTVEPTVLADREFAHDGPADSVAARG